MVAGDRNSLPFSKCKFLAKHIWDSNGWAFRRIICTYSIDYFKHTNAANVVKQMAKQKTFCFKKSIDAQDTPTTMRLFCVRTCEPTTPETHARHNAIFVTHKIVATVNVTLNCKHTRLFLFPSSSSLSFISSSCSSSTCVLLFPLSLRLYTHFRFGFILVGRATASY